MGKSGWGRVSQEFRINIYILLGFPSGSGVKNPPANAGDRGLIPRWQRSPEGRNDNPLQYFFFLITFIS